MSARFLHPEEGWRKRSSVTREDDWPRDLVHTDGLVQFFTWLRKKTNFLVGNYTGKSSAGWLEEMMSCSVK